jgi:Zn-finger nucleic acid-binding protein
MTDRGPTKPSPTEDEFFAKEDVEKKRKMALQLARDLAADERRRLRDLHHLHCPRCGMPMQEVKAGGLDLAVCFSCGGAFFGKGDIARIAHPRQKGIMAAILNWFRDETQSPVK